MKKLICLVLVVMLALSMSICAMADALSIDEMQEKLNEYANYLQGSWKTTDIYTRVLGSEYSLTVGANGSGISINSSGEVYASSYSAFGEILFTTDKNTIFVKIPTNGGAYRTVEMVRKQ